MRIEKLVEMEVILFLQPQLLRTLLLIPIVGCTHGEKERQSKFVKIPNAFDVSSSIV